MTKSIRRIAVVTGSRAEFGLLRTAMAAIDQSRNLELQTIVTGTHLIADTWQDIPFEIPAKVPMQVPEETGRHADVAALGRGVTGIGQALAELEPDVVLVLGDRIEAFAAASAASIGGIHLAHSHGGDRAEGVADEAMRHAISKLAHIHFPATTDSAERLIRMGEDPANVHIVGSPAIDGLSEVLDVNDQTLSGLGVDPAEPYIMILMHPTGESDEVEQQRMAALLDETNDLQRIVLEPNYDPGRDGIVAAIKAADCQTVAHLPREVFLSMLHRAAVLIGNSSAGLIEASAVREGGVPVVNIGSRQAGRQRAANVIDCDHHFDSIRSALERAMNEPPRAQKHPFGDGCTGQRIADLLESIELTNVPIRKLNRY